MFFYKSAFRNTNKKMGKPAAARLRDHLDVAEVIIPDWLLVFVEEE